MQDTIYNFAKIKASILYCSIAVFLVCMSHFRYAIQKSLHFFLMQNHVIHKYLFLQ